MIFNINSDSIFLKNLNLHNITFELKYKYKTDIFNKISKDLEEFLQRRGFISYLYSNKSPLYYEEHFQYPFMYIESELSNSEIKEKLSDFNYDFDKIEEKYKEYARNRYTFIFSNKNHPIINKIKSKVNSDFDLKLYISEKCVELELHVGIDCYKKELFDLKLHADEIYY